MCTDLSNLECSRAVFFFSGETLLSGKTVPGADLDIVAVIVVFFLLGPKPQFKSSIIHPRTQRSDEA